MQVPVQPALPAGKNLFAERADYQRNNLHDFVRLSSDDRQDLTRPGWGASKTENLSFGNVGVPVAPGEMEAKKVEVAYERIKDLIINFRFRPGAQLHIAELSEHLDVSVTPVREALTRLLAENLVVGIPNRGFFCKSIDVDELCDFYEFAYLLLRHSLKLGLRTCPASQLFGQFHFDNIPLDPQGSNGETEPRVCAELIEGLYSAISTLSRNKLVVADIAKFNIQSRYIRFVDLADGTPIARARQQMAGLVEILLSRDAEAAIDCLHGMFQDKLSRMSNLARDGLARAYLAPNPTANGVEKKRKSLVRGRY